MQIPYGSLPSCCLCILSSAVAAWGAGDAQLALSLVFLMVTSCIFAVTTIWHALLMLMTESNSNSITAMHVVPLLACALGGLVAAWFGNSRLSLDLYAVPTFIVLLSPLLWSYPNIWMDNPKSTFAAGFGVVGVAAFMAWFNGYPFLALEILGIAALVALFFVVVLGNVKTVAYLQTSEGIVRVR